MIFISALAILGKVRPNLEKAINEIVIKGRITILLNQAHASDWTVVIEIPSLLHDTIASNNEMRYHVFEFLSRK